MLPIALLYNLTDLFKKHLIILFSTKEPESFFEIVVRNSPQVARSLIRSNRAVDKASTTFVFAKVFYLRKLVSVISFS